MKNKKADHIKGTARKFGEKKTFICFIRIVDQKSFKFLTGQKKSKIGSPRHRGARAWTVRARSVFDISDFIYG